MGLEISAQAELLVDFSHSGKGRKKEKWPSPHQEEVRTLGRCSPSPPPSPVLGKGRFPLSQWEMHDGGQGASCCEQR